MQKRTPPPILLDKYFDAPSAFTPESLLREARRQKGLANGVVPAICLLDPDGDLVHRLKTEGRATRDPAWACYHTELHRFVEAGIEFGIVGCAVGAAFAVLIAEELLASGCRLLISMTSAGQIAPLRPPPYFILIDRALRDEGTATTRAAPRSRPSSPRDRPRGDEAVWPHRPPQAGPAALRCVQLCVRLP